VVACLSLDPRFAGPNPVEDDGILRAINIRSTTFFGVEVKTSVPRRLILRHVKEPCGMKEILRKQKFIVDFFAKCLLFSYQMSILVIAGDILWTNQE
jgi:hypothetical protein